VGRNAAAGGGIVTFSNTILADNEVECAGTVISLDYNLILRILISRFRDI